MNGMNQSQFQKMIKSNSGIAKGTKNQSQDLPRMRPFLPLPLTALGYSRSEWGILGSPRDLALSGFVRNRLAGRHDENFDVLAVFAKGRRHVPRVLQV
jgi:hypothetical protein